MISISAPTYDPAGSIRLQELPSSDTDTVRRRVSRAKTLDGGVVINDGGYAPGDRTIRVRWRIQSEAQFLAVQRLVQTYPQLTACTREGVFTVAPEAVAKKGLEGDLTLLVVS